MTKSSEMPDRAASDFSNSYAEHERDRFDEQAGPTSDTGSRFDDDDQQEVEVGDGDVVMAITQPASAVPTYRRSLFRR